MSLSFCYNLLQPIHFPEANYQELERVEEFHNKLSKILKKEYKEKSDEIQLLLSVVNEKITSCETRAKQIKAAPNVSKAILIRFAELTKSVELLKEANKNYVESQKLQKIAKDEKEKYEALVTGTFKSTRMRGHDVPNIQSGRPRLTKAR